MVLPWLRERGTERADERGRSTDQDADHANVANNNGSGTPVELSRFCGHGLTLSMYFLFILDRRAVVE